MNNSMINNDMFKEKIILVLFFILFTASSAIAAAGIPRANTLKDIRYGNDKNQSFDLDQPSGLSDLLIVFVHGGGWSKGDKEKYVGRITKYFAKQGFSAVNMNYRLAPEWKYDAPLRDIASVLKSIDADKEKFSLKANYKIALMGHSAGAHLVALFAVKESFYGVDNIDYVVGFAGPYDFEAFTSRPRRNFLGDTPAKEASPLAQAKKGDQTKFLLITGKNDIMVSPDQTYAFSEALNSKGIYNETLTVKGKGHLTIITGIPRANNVAKKILEFMGR